MWIISFNPNNPKRKAHYTQFTNEESEKYKGQITHGKTSAKCRAKIVIQGA